MLGDDNDGVGVVGNPAGEAPQQTAGQCHVAVPVVQNPLQIVAPVGDDERHPLGQRKQSALTELRMHQVEVLSRQPAPRLVPRHGVVERVALALERKHLHLDAGRSEKRGLARDELRGPPRDPGPLGCDHQDAHHAGLSTRSGSSAWPQPNLRSRARRPRTPCCQR